MPSPRMLDRLAIRWIVLAALGLTGVALGIVALAPRPVAPPVRVAIRVACDPAACATAEAFAVDVWSEERGPDLPLDLVVPRDRLAALAALGVTWQVLVDDIDAAAAAEAARLRSPARTAEWSAEYHDYRAIAAHLEELAASAPDRVALQPIGASLEGRPIWALRIGAPGARAALPILIDATQHAREWIAAAVATCIADRMVRDYERDPAIRAFANTTRLWVVPVVNPDGYQYTWSGDRYWRKNRRDQVGVDLNRNFPVGFGGAGSSGNRRSDIYRGPYAFSEPESSALRDLVRREQIALHVDYHAYGQMLLYPWAYTGTPTKDRDRFAAIGDRMTSAMVAAHDTPYRLSSAIEFYPAAGAMMDWMYGEAGALSYAIELRPRWPGGRGGFVLPPEEIRPTCDEGMAALLA
ncbi:MAG TPA: M14 family zinc carboxypeptidase, partial [Kofleriaceae bacterium]